MKKRLPPIFEKMRFKLGKEHAPMMVMDLICRNKDAQEVFDYVNDNWPDRGTDLFEDYKFVDTPSLSIINNYMKIQKFKNPYKIWTEGISIIDSKKNYSLAFTYDEIANPQALLKELQSVVKDRTLIRHAIANLSEYFFDNFGKICCVKWTTFSPHGKNKIVNCTILNFTTAEIIANKNFWNNILKNLKMTHTEYEYSVKKQAVNTISNLVHILRASEKQADPSVNTHDRNKASGFVRVGDTIRYDYLEDLASQSGNDALRGYVRPEVSSGIRKREHQVRGHVRIRNGRTIWVRSHKRGDAELGRVTRVIH